MALQRKRFARPLPHFHAQANEAKWPPHPLAKFFADRGPHLAAMIAYFALLSFVPLVFLALALLGFAGRRDAASFFVTELRRAFPGTSVNGILAFVRTAQQNATALGVLGGTILLWSALSLFSGLESALNIVYGRPNRRFFHGKGIATLIMAASLLTLFVSLLAGALGAEILRRYLRDAGGDSLHYAASMQRRRLAFSCSYLPYTASCPTYVSPYETCYQAPSPRQSHSRPASRCFRSS